MSKGRLPMRKIKEILRLKHENGLSVRKIGTCCNLHSSTVSDYLAGQNSRHIMANTRWYG